MHIGTCISGPLRSVTCVLAEGLLRRKASGLNQAALLGVLRFCLQTFVPCRFLKRGSVVDGDGDDDGGDDDEGRGDGDDDADGDAHANADVAAADDRCHHLDSSHGDEHCTLLPMMMRMLRMTMMAAMMTMLTMMTMTTTRLMMMMMMMMMTRMMRITMVRMMVGKSSDRSYMQTSMARVVQALEVKLPEILRASMPVDMLLCCSIQSGSP